MAAIMLYVEVPKRLDAKKMQPHAQRYLRQWFGRMAEVLSNQECYLKALESDTGFDDWCAHWRGQHPVLPFEQFVRASVYHKEGYIRGAQELNVTLAFHDYSSETYIQNPFSSDPRRPVRLRGGFYAIAHKYTRGLTFFAEQVADRYLRITKYTEFDREKHQAAMSDLGKRIQKKMPEQLMRTFCPGHQVSCYSDEATFWLDGVHHEGRRVAEMLVARADYQRRLRTPRRLKKKLRIKEAQAIATAVYELGLIKEGELA